MSTEVAIRNARGTMSEGLFRQIPEALEWWHPRGYYSGHKLPARFGGGVWERPCPVCNPRLWLPEKPYAARASKFAHVIYAPPQFEPRRLRPYVRQINQFSRMLFLWWRQGFTPRLAGGRQAYRRYLRGLLWKIRRRARLFVRPKRVVRRPDGLLVVKYVPRRRLPLCGEPVYLGRGRKRPCLRPVQNLHHLRERHAYERLGFELYGDLKPMCRPHHLRCH